MKKNDLYRKDDSILRVIHIQENQIMVIDCMKFTMPVCNTSHEEKGYLLLNMRQNFYLRKFLCVMNLQK